MLAALVVFVFTVAAWLWFGLGAGLKFRSELGFRSMRMRILFEPMNAVLLNSVTARLAESGAANVTLADCLWRA